MAPLSILKELFNSFMRLNNAVKKLIINQKLAASPDGTEQEGYADGLNEDAEELDLSQGLKDSEQPYVHSGKAISTVWKPTDVIAGFEVRCGFHTVNGATALPGAVNFTVSSDGAEYCELLLFHRKKTEPFAVLPLPEKYRVGKVWAILVFGLNIEEFEYSYRMDGPYDPSKGLLFDRSRQLLDPYAKAVVGQRKWGESQKRDDAYHARVVRNTFDWHDQGFLRTPIEDSVIYELHVRGFTRHASSGVEYPGTFAGIVEKIPYLKELGITAVELMPIFEFDEVANGHENAGEKLYEYWGYNTVAFFAPNTSYAASAEYNREGNELRQLIRLLKENGIEVILDVVFNHTAEGNEDGDVISFKGMDNNIFYMLAPDGSYYNFSGCGNTVNCNHPTVQQFIVDCLEYWVSEYHVDGFRFDLASILGRDENGAPMENPPLLQRLAEDPLLRDTKLIAEAWDAGGLYQVGTFPAYNRWAEWNGKYRDELRDFLKGNFWNAPETAARITGSTDMYYGMYKGYASSINFLTCHDGFTLYDLYSYNEKHNEANGWNNSDGASDNRSWNCGEEGETDNPKIKALRFQMMRNAITTLMCSRGTPMILAGDEFGNTQFGNNNSYCQDNEISWLNWELLDRNRIFFEFYKNVISFRRKHPSIRKKLPAAKCGLTDCMISGVDPDDHLITQNNRTLCVLYAGHNEKEDDVVYFTINSYWEPQIIRLPALPAGYGWGVAIDTADRDGHYYHSAPLFLGTPYYELMGRSVAAFTMVKLPGR